MLAALLLAALSPAQAQTALDFTFHPTPVLTAADVPWGETVGSPSVVYNSVEGQFYMFFESRMTATDPDCPVGMWAIGYATSTDGTSWTVSNKPIVEPNPASSAYYNCVAAHPGAHYQEVDSGLGRGVINVFFKAEQSDDACDVTTPSWGCEQYTGVGRYRIRFDGGAPLPASQLISANPVIQKSTNFGYPKPLLFDGTWLMSYGVYPNVEIASAPAAFGPWTEQGVILDHNQAAQWAWSRNELFSPAIACEQGATLPLESWVGGRDTLYGIVVNGGLGRATQLGVPTAAWTLGSTPYFDILDDDEFRHWDLLRVDEAGDSEVLFWYDSKDASGNNEIFFAYTTADIDSWNLTDVYLKECTTN